jgi:hypothetical protein
MPIGDFTIQNYFRFEDPHKYDNYGKALKATLQEHNLSDPIVAMAGADPVPLVGRAGNLRH